jgi:ribosomal protein S18 acetylase RimI-like enzyme
MFERQWRPFFATKRRLGRRYRCVGRPSREFHAIPQKPHPDERPHEQAYDVKERKRSGSRVSFLEGKMGGCCFLLRARSSEVRAAVRHLLSPTPASVSAAARRDFAQHLQRRAHLQQGTTQTSSFVGLLDYFNMSKRKDVASSVDMPLLDKPAAKKAKSEAKQAMHAPTRKEKLVAGINALSIEDFRSRFVQEDMLKYETDRKDTPGAFDISLVAADWLTPGEYNASFNLIEQTSRSDYESSTFGWHPRRKRKEMLEPEMKYLLVRSRGAEPTIDRTSKSGVVDTSVLGFLSFMVDHDSSPTVPVLYIYEIHLSESLRGLGLGNHLMQVTERLANNMGLDMVMLTCFLCNKKAHHFYTDRGFGKDACSPADRKTRNKVIAVDYVIMSKSASVTVAEPRQIADDNAHAELEESNEIRESTILATT